MNKWRMFVWGLIIVSAVAVGGEARAQGQVTSLVRYWCEQSALGKVVCAVSWLPVAVGPLISPDATPTPPPPVNHFTLEVGAPHHLEPPDVDCGVDCQMIRLYYDMDSARCPNVHRVGVLVDPPNVPASWTQEIDSFAVGPDTTTIDVRTAGGSWTTELEHWRDAFFVCQILEVR